MTMIVIAGGVYALAGAFLSGAIIAPMRGRYPLAAIVFAVAVWPAAFFDLLGDDEENNG